MQKYKNSYENSKELDYLYPWFEKMDKSPWDQNK